ncbi:hypothetical protein Acr_00g0064400 [Actinidia rufa]|uniref:Uncharacterized protein n=1 Tax=Actinidia rufa TaxID=165716 RepID=A0A7J0DPI1_9ERIC|nr:hypothetical protein Acr_00g0064400 [Actinidia rufa]
MGERHYHNGPNGRCGTSKERDATLEEAGQEDLVEDWRLGTSRLTSGGPINGKYPVGKQLKGGSRSTSIIAGQLETTGYPIYTCPWIRRAVGRLPSRWAFLLIGIVKRQNIGLQPLAFPKRENDFVGSMHLIHPSQSEEAMEVEAHFWTRGNVNGSKQLNHVAVQNQFHALRRYTEGGGPEQSSGSFSRLIVKENPRKQAKII